MAAYQRRLNRAGAFLRSEPTAPGLTVTQDEKVQEQKLLTANRAAAQAVGFPLLVLAASRSPPTCSSPRSPGR